MSIAEYFTPVSDASVTFNGAHIQLDSGSGSGSIDQTDSKQNIIPNLEQLNDLTFQANGGEMVLVLGKPTSSLFKSLFSAKKSLNYSPSGSIQFKANEYKSYASNCPHQIIYNNEQDIHFPFLTVQQTLDFALSCKFNVPVEERVKIRNELLKEFGLSHVLDTVVGNDFVRGVSGGERKRISIIETFIANGSVYLWDNSTKGLDSSTALDFLSILQKMTRATNSVNLVKISQASDKIVSKFDKILMLTDSYQIFYGTVDECLTYFHDTLGIPKNPNDCIIEYLTSILNLQFHENKSVDSGAQRLNTISRSLSNISVDSDLKDKMISTEVKDLNLDVDNIRTETDLYHLWIKSPYYRHWKNQVSQNPQNSDLNSDDITQRFNISLTKQIMFLIERAFQRSLGDKIYLIAQTISVIIQSLVIGSLFYDTPLNTIGSYSRGSLTFFSILFFTFLSLAEMPAGFQRQPVVSKQAKLHFYYFWVETLATTVFEYLFKLILVFIFSILLYFLAHLQYNAARFFIFLLFLALYNFAMVSLFSLTTMLAPTLSIANLFAGILLLAIAMYASYVIYLHDMHPWFVWIAYLNPARYAMESILANELYNLKLDCADSIVPRGPAYSSIDVSKRACAWRGATLGNDYVRGRDYLAQGLDYSYSHVWRNFGIIIAFLVFFLFCSLVASQYIKPKFNKENTEVWSNIIYRYLPFSRVSKTNARSPTSNHGSSIEMKKVVSLATSIDSSTDTIVQNSESNENGEVVMEAVQSQKHIISWRNINYTVNGDKQLINNVSGYISSGLTALMGESGAGKTTLLNVLSQRVESGVVTGELLIDGKPLTNEDAFKRSIGFVQQQDLHLDLLTVKESLEISCVLRGDGDTAYLATISDLLKLPPNSLVADLSPTEKKLLSIGVELVTKPSLLLFLDEPTSGLDSEAALTIVKFLKKLSQQGQAIFCTIHQPSKSVISYFDNVFLLKRGGESVFFGPTTEACNYFTSRDDTLTFDPEYDNPADFIIDVVGNNENKNPDEHGDLKRTTNWAELWENSDEKRGIENRLQVLEQDALAENIDYTTSVWAQPSYWYQLMTIVKRQYICTKRDKTYVAAKFLLNGGAGLFIGFSFWDIKKSLGGLQDCIFFCFMALCVSSPLINQVQDKALKSKEVFVAREARSNTYHWSILLLAQTIIELPLAITSSTVFFFCAYFCCKFDNSPHIAGVFYLNYIVFSAYYSSFGLWLIYTAPNLQTAAVFVAFFYSFTASFCGVMQPYGMFPGFWKFMYRVSPYTYFIDTFVSLVLHDREVVCENMELIPGQPPSGQNCGQFMAPYMAEYGGYLKNPNTFTVCGFCTYTVGDDFLAVENMSYDNRWRNFGIECAFVAFNIIAMFIGYYMTYVSKVWPKVFKVVRMIVPNGKRLKKVSNDSK
ncbi:ATP-binding cassette sterol transporter AUS1 NDAI_0A08370 [Naumovozyma dairenensis CBS 421]|uniref:ABC transporter domain-containing protein n=1 Tax=Naumovozyma dairenensis (strain ATCC 10597 / BCRC 20456 / CBS 421 / NBRC 0211 / NRRL Y-12639) TaxID=1071378 RepID=G0W5A2_NAUDC|nr:hypothetical protein NDAI_0A08370 [Naumovozyma dairenensis CBS 421]CCD22990.1 hypothetical protein NDAI_0A08370 [Naumovozyma dairenensis CBS 421]